MNLYQERIAKAISTMTAVLAMDESDDVAVSMILDDMWKLLASTYGGDVVLTRREYRAWFYNKTT